jgi:hypothetical protein
MPVKAPIDRRHWPIETRPMEPTDRAMNLAER